MILVSATVTKKAFVVINFQPVFSFDSLTFTWRHLEQKKNNIKQGLLRNLSKATDVLSLSAFFQEILVRKGPQNKVYARKGKVRRAKVRER